MIVVETYSHFNGLEFLEVHRNDLFNELKQLVNGLNAADVGTAVQNSLAPYVHKGSVSQRHHDQLEGRDWHYSSSARIECFNKRRIGLKFCFDLKVGEERSEFNDFCSRYRCDEIDVGVGLFPMERTERDIGSADFRTAVQTLKECGRAGAVVPLALFAIGA